MFRIEAGKSMQAELFALAIDFPLVRFEEVAIQVNLAEEFLSGRHCGCPRQQLSWCRVFDRGNFCQDRSIMPEPTKITPPYER